MSYRGTYMEEYREWHEILMPKHLIALVTMTQDWTTDMQHVSHITSHCCILLSTTQYLSSCNTIPSTTHNFLWHRGSISLQHMHTYMHITTRSHLLLRTTSYHTTFTHRCTLHWGQWLTLPNPLCAPLQTWTQEYPIGWVYHMIQ